MFRSTSIDVAQNGRFPIRSINIRSIRNTSQTSQGFILEIVEQVHLLRCIFSNTTSIYGAIERLGSLIVRVFPHAGEFWEEVIDGCNVCF